jgi:hypothetical protein
MQQRFRKLLIAAGVLGGLLLLALGGLRALSRAQTPHGWGPIRGQFVDAETGQPLQGVAVLMVWWKEEGLFQSHRRFYDAREAVSDAQGRFEVPGIWVPLWRPGVQPGQSHFFAPGYAYDSRVVTPPGGVPYEDPTVVKMRRLKTRYERIENQRRYPPSIPAHKMPLLLEALNWERAALGFEPITRGDVSDP